MLLGLLGDIHGNHVALQAVLDSARALGVEKLLLTGDFVGYYFEPAKVLELLAGWDTHAVRGNHEDMLKNVIGDDTRMPGYEKQYGSGLRIAVETLDRRQIDYLVSLPHPLALEVSSRRILLCHGTPWDNNEYLYPDAPAEKLQRCTAGGHDLVVVGHSHYSMVHQVGGTQLVNPGSVGQPRDRKPGAAWATYDTSTGEAALKREQYDAGSLITEAGRRHPEIPYLARVLVRT